MTLSVTERVQHALDRLEQVSGLNALAHPMKGEALGRAEMLDETGPQDGQALFGVPVVIKGNIAVAGQPFDGGSPALEGCIASEDASAVARLRQAGAVVVGITNLHELAFGITSANAHFGPVASPADPTRMAGGSSGGTAAAVAAGCVPAGLGTDTGGSGRLPAAMCGCVGLRPTTGRYASDGVLTLSDTVDTIAPFGADVEQVALLDAVLSGEADVQRPDDPAQLRIGVVGDPYWTGLSHEMEATGRDVLRQLEASGISLVPLEAPGVGEMTAQSGFPVVLHETRANWIAFAQDMKGQSLIEFAGNIASPDVRGLFEALSRGELPGPEVYEAATTTVLPALRDGMKALFEGNRLDALISPTLVSTAPKLGNTEEITINGEAKPLFDAMTARSLIASMAGLPAVSMPFGLGPDGMPFSVELVGAAGADRHLLAVARILEGLTK